MEKITCFVREHPNLKVVGLMAFGYFCWRQYQNAPRWSLKGKVAVVTGASTGIGRETAIQLAVRHGMHVAVVARSSQLLTELCEEIQRQGGHATPFPCDCADPEAVASAAQAVEDQLGPVDVLVNSAGAGRWLPLVDTSASEFKSMVGAPYAAAFNWMHELLPGQLARNRPAYIVNINSPACLCTWPSSAVYGSVRYALRGLTYGAQADTRGSPVTVGHLILGETASNYWEANPGAAKNMPWLSKLMPRMTVQTAGDCVVTAVRARKIDAVDPLLLRPLTVLNSVWPSGVAFMAAFPVRPYFLRPLI